MTEINWKEWQKWAEARKKEPRHPANQELIKELEQAWKREFFSVFSSPEERGFSDGTI